MMNADSLFLNGKIYTVDPGFSIAEALAVRDGKILWVGSNEQLKKHAGKETRIFDLKGRTVIPGLVESHLHFLPYGELLLQINAFQKTKEEILAEVKSAYEKREPGEWILGRGWNELFWEEKTLPSREELDAVAPDVPVCLVRVCGHTSWVNSKALEVSGISKETQNPVGGEIFRDSQGEPTGILTDTAAHPIRRLIPTLTDSKKSEAYQAAQKDFFSHGFTSVHDMAANIGYDYGTIEFMKKLYQEGIMQIGICAYVAAPHASAAYEVGAETGLFEDRFSVRGIKFFGDGSLGARSAWMLEEYSDRAGHCGNGRFSDEELYSMIVEARRNGFQVITHAIGDAANRQVLDVYERVLKEVPEPKDHRFRIEHAQILAQEDITRFAALGVIPSMQFVHCSSDKNMTEDRIGAARLKGAFVWRQLLDLGLIIPGGSDAPVELVNPFHGMYAAVTRKDREGLPEGGWCADQKISRIEALKSFTIWGAYAGFDERTKGSIEVGKYADFAVLDRDILHCPEDAIKDTVVTATVLRGHVVYGEVE